MGHHRIVNSKMKIVAVFLLAIAVVWSGDPITKGDKDPIVSAGCTIKNTGHNGQAWPSYKASPAKCVADCKKNPLCVATTSSLAGDCWLLHTYEGSRLYTKVGYLLFRKNCKGNGGCTVRDYGHNGSALTHYKASNAKCKLIASKSLNVLLLHIPLPMTAGYFILILAISTKRRDTLFLKRTVIKEMEVVQ